MPEYRTIAVDPETYDRIAELARENGRSIGSQVTMMTRMITQKIMRVDVVEIDTLPGPEDAEIIPVVTVKKSE